MRFTCRLLLLFALGTAAAQADDLCSDPKEKAAASAQLSKAKSLEAAGKLEDAYAAGSAAGDDCVDGAAFKQQVARTIAARAEAGGQYRDAVDWYIKASAAADADRVIRKWVQVTPVDRNAVAAGIDFYRLQNDAAQEQAIRDIAKRRVEAILAEEARMFSAPQKGTYALLLDAQEWAFHANWGKPQIDQRAQQRGDAYAKQASRRFLEEAMRYYELGGSRTGVDAVKGRAATLGQQAEGRGEIELAIEYYRLAEEDARADALDKRNAALKEKAEAQRKQSFKQEQDDLEKELGL
jgi:hypothetical protein